MIFFDPEAPHISHISATSLRADSNLHAQIGLYYILINTLHHKSVRIHPFYCFLIEGPIDRLNCGDSLLMER